ncbi:MAG: hypothetical protein A3G29_09640 [Burkholderiales bacterium RIFCSPLOWO2_12_FULL_64_99]|jgi:uncharacterized protein (TIGR00251 family)|uniref:DUF167 domain-containing protein n=1 Tax=Aquabacterium sp. TaxID=1872578 RepID=UPI0008BBD0D3|nr:DUF167 domain-containing protein [Aquabacterium sp.]OGB03162.1 MAG: hypothetical protein A3E52_08075 [Burkholderiales bacterium RIFCSPHIGHO2_12_FULL_63_20]OGB65079.1 MAG: hypothetical protein A3G29_09640 [Burkholderiales bacterium RIFCSPLOWO2_12_FULL_64_99]
MNLPSPPWPCLRLDGKGPQPKVILDVSVSPNAKRTELVGWHDGALRVRLSAPPVDGAANEALRKWLAAELGVPQARVTLLRGASGRRKQWAIDAPEADVSAWLGRQSVLQS